MRLNKKGDFGGPWDWINILIVILLLTLGILAYYGIGISVFGYVLGVLFVIAGIFGMIDGWLIDGIVWKFLATCAFLVVTLIGANLVFRLPYIGNYLTPAQELYSAPGIVSYVILVSVILILIIDIFMSDEM